MYGEFDKATGKPTQTGQGEPLKQESIQQKLEKLFASQQNQSTKRVHVHVVDDILLSQPCTLSGRLVKN